MAHNSSPVMVKNAAKSFIEFLNKSVTPFHAVEVCEFILKKAGFREVFERDHFDVAPGEKYFIKKNQSSIFAFAVGGQYVPGNGFSVIAAHTDSPCLRVKPISKRTAEKFLQVGVSTYGGGLWRTWFDRDLSVAGQVIFQRNGAIYHKLVDVKRPIFHIPNLAIHLDTNRKTFEFNAETHLLPILATTTISSKCEEAKKACEETKEGGDKLNCSIADDHHDEFLKLIAHEANCEIGELVDLDLYLYDAQPAVLSGLYEEFISGARLDNLVGTYTAINGLVNSLENPDSLCNDSNIRLVACYDNEEVGSQSAQGARTSFTEWLLRRLANTPHDPMAFERSMAKSYLVSADQAHGVHPNYAPKHEDKHRPAFHGGVVVKVNVNQNYATTALSHAVFKVIADRASVPLQKVVVRNDSLCGGTVGPMLSAALGLQAIDVGCAQLAMHSIRELADASSISQSTTLYSTFFEQLSDVLDNVQKVSE